MIDRLKHFLAPPTFANEEENRIANILNVILITLFTAGVLMIFLMVTFSNGLTTGTLIIAMFVILICYGLMRKGHLRAASFSVLLMLICMDIAILSVGFGVHDPAIMLLPIIIIIGGLVLDTRMFVVFTGLTVLSVGFVIVLEVNGHVQNAVFTTDSKGLEFIIYATILVITAVTVRLLTQNLKDNLARAEKADAQWRALVKNAPDLISYLQPDGTIDFLNSVMDEPNINVIGRTVYDFTLSDYHEAVRVAIERVLTTEESSSYESIGFKRNGEQGWYDNRIGPVKQLGTVVGLVMISTNITERREMELALESERDFAQRIIENMGQGLTIIDENHQFIYANPAYTRMTGYSLASLVGKSPWDIIAEEYRGQLDKQAVVRQAGETSSYAVDMKHCDGHTVHVLITGVPRWQDGEYIGSIAVITDLTEQIEAERERERLIAQLEAQNAELERFTYTVSHDLKSPLITVRGFLGVLMKGLEKGDEADVQTAVDHIDNAAKKMEALLRDLLELSRVGRVINLPEETPFADIVQEAMSLVVGQREIHDVQIMVADDLPVVYVDRVRLIEVMQNLLENAIKFSQEQPQPLIEVGMASKNGEILFFVRDNGVGIEPQYHEKVFGLFERLDDSVDGTGIGLAVVKRIIEVHNGRLWVESAGEGQGATFYFTLPLPEPENGIELP